MKTIKIIDLLNIIAKGNEEEIPNKIKSNDIIYNFNFIDWKYYSEARKQPFQHLNLTADSILNREVEIIEEEKELKKVLEIELLGQCDNWLQKRDVNIKSDFELNPYIINTITKNFELLYKKQCEIVDAVNELRKEK